MNITIIGASKGIGKEILARALKKEHKVTVLARTPQKIEITHENLQIVPGDFLKYHSVEKSIKNAEAVIVSVGSMPARKPVELFSAGTKHLLGALKESGKQPLIIAITGIGAGDSKGHGGFFYDKIFNPLLLKTIYEDKNKQEEMLAQEYENWIVVRPGMLTNGKLTENYRALTDLSGIHGGKISRADVAHFVLEQIENPTFKKQRPLLIY